MTRGASHLRSLKTLALPQSRQLIGGVNAAHAFGIRIQSFVMSAQIITWSIHERITEDLESARVALGANVELSFAVEFGGVDDVFGSRFVRMSLVELDMITTGAMAAFARDSQDGRIGIITRKGGSAKLLMVLPTRS
jgi:hypothetical protein